MANRFPARFDGECSRCPNSFDEGDEIGYDDEDELVCSECLSRDDEEQEQSLAAWRKFGFGKGTST